MQMESKWTRLLFHEYIYLHSTFAYNFAMKQSVIERRMSKLKII